MFEPRLMCEPRLLYNSLDDLPVIPVSSFVNFLLLLLLLALLLFLLVVLDLPLVLVEGEDGVHNQTVD